MADISRLPSTSFPSPSSDNLMSTWIMTISVMKHFFHVPFVANCADSSSGFFGKVHTCQVKPFIIRLAAHKKPVFTEKKNVVDTDFILFHRFADFPWFISRAWRMQLWFQLILINLFSVFRWHRDIRVLFRPHWDSAVRECSAISVDGATTDLRPVEARRCEINDRTVSEVILIVDSFLFAFFATFFVALLRCRKKEKWNDRNQFSLQSRTGTCLPQARDCDGRDVDCWCAVVGDWRTALHLVNTTQSTCRNRFN